MSQTNHGRHAKAAPRGGAGMLRRGGLVAAALAVLVAAIVAIPALVALAAPDFPLSVTIEAKSSSGYPKTDIIAGEDVWDGTATYTVTVTTDDSSVELDTTGTTVTGTVDGTVGWVTDSAWTESVDGEGGTTYTRDFTVSESAHNQVTVATLYSETDDPADESLTGPTDTKTVTVDMYDPKVSIVFNDVMVGRDEDEDVVYFADEDLTATVTVTDPTFDPDKSSVETSKPQQDVTWKRVGNTDSYTCTVDCTNISSFTVHASDGVNHSVTAPSSDAVDENNSQLMADSFEIDDRNIPEIEFSSDVTPREGNYFDKDVPLKVMVKGDNPVVEGLDTTDGWTLNDDDPDAKVYTKTFSEEGTQTISVSAKNQGRFKTQRENQYTFTVDKTDPKVDVTYNLEDVTSSIYDTENEDLEATIVITEATSWNPDLIKVTLNDEPQQVSWNDGKELGTYEAKVVLPKDAVTGLDVTGTDAAGRELDASASTVDLPSTVTTDATDPVIAITYVNDEDAKVEWNGKGYFNTPVTPTITVAEANFVEEKTNVEVKVDDAEVQLDELQWTEGKNGTWSCTLDRLADEGDYSIEVTTTDAAGHDADIKTDEFTIDTTRITFDVVWEGSDAEEPLEGEDDDTAYYPSARTATITPSETNFSFDEITVSTGSETVKPVWNEDEGAWIVSYPDDGSYRLQAYGFDDADNEAECYDSYSFVVDTQPPVLKVEFADNDAAKDTDGDDVKYYDDVRTATITVDELNFSVERVDIETTGDYDADSWETKGTVHTLTVTFPNSVDNHYLNVSVSDRAGNEGVNADGEPFEYESGAFVVDEIDPEVSIGLNKSHVQTYSGSDFFAEAPTVDVTVKDAHFNPETSKIEATGATFGEWVKGGTVDGITTWTSTATFSEGTGRTFTVRAYDWSKNDEVMSYKDIADTGSATFTVDLSAPVVTDAYMSNPSSNNYNGDHFFFDAKTTMSVVVVDNIGLESFQVVKDGDTSNYYVAMYPKNVVNVEGGRQYIIQIALADGETFDNTIRVCTKDHAGNLRYWDLTPNGEEVYVTHVEDVTNPPVFDGIYPDSLLQDTVFPKLTLTGPAAGSYSNTPQTVSMSVDELNVPILKTYEPDQVVLTVTRVAGDASAATTTWTRPVSQLAHANDITYGLSESLSADGHYTVSAQVTDPAGNQAKAELAEFTIDQTAPVVEVTFDNNDVRNGKYYKAGRTATITVTEHNFDPSLITIETNGSVGGWSTSGDVHTATVSFTTDGVYNLSVSGADMAGNAMAAYQADEFVVDLQAPEITFDGVEDQTAYNDSVQPAIIFTDEANFDANGVSYTITGTKNGEVTYETFVSDQEQGQTVTYADFVREAEVDDIYTIDASLTDLAGNETEGTITFSVNRFGSTFRVLDAGSYAENNGYLLEGRDVVVEEINVSGVESEKHAVTVTEGTSVTKLALNETPQATGYTIDEETSEDPESNGWSVYTYRIPAGNFVRDGRYHVSVESEDLAANTNTSSNYYDREEGKTAAAEVDFILDTTDPVVTSLNIEDGAVYETGTYEGTFTVVENIGVQGVEVLVDGEAVEVTDDGYGNYSFKVESASFTPRSLSITATDLAGRTGSAGADDFRVTTDIFELHLPWVIAGIVAVVVVAGGLICFFVIKRRRDEDEDAKKAA